MAAIPRRRVTIYTDGSCVGNPGPGGYGIILDYKGHRKEISGGYRKTTNNRMELLAAIHALAALKEPCCVTLYSDSEYLVKAMNKRWPYSWWRKGWRRSSGGKSVANPDLWMTLLGLCQKHHVDFCWVRGHDGQAENERCDQLALAAARSNALSPDTEYERGVST